MDERLTGMTPEQLGFIVLLALVVIVGREVYARRATWWPWAAALGARAPDPIIKHRSESYTPALYNESDLTKKMVALFKDVIGPERVHERPMSMGGEDFSQFTRAGLRTFYWHLGTADAKAFAAAKQGGKVLANTHSPYYAPVPEPTLRTGVKAMTSAVLDLMKK